MSPRLILVRHSLPQIDRDVPARHWRLSGEGRRRCEALAQRLELADPLVLFASTEPKAKETAEILARHLGRPFETVEGLHEHERSNVGWLGQERFEAAIASLFAQPQRRVFGCETAEQARARFCGGVAGLLERSPDVDVAVVTHGTVLTLFVAWAVGVEPFSFWKRLGMPSFVVLSRPDFEMLRLVEDVTTTGTGGSG
jgi:broad specificity phosphatase PhoE